ncbi:Uncharacterised protein [uncultured archaeon]|nr:Uncharacterised protein [uncultured archaeon]
MGSKIKDWKNELKKHKNLILLSLLFLIIAIVLDYLSGIYVDKVGTIVATDLILDNIPVVNLNFIFVYLFVLVIAIGILYALFFKVRMLHKVIAQGSLLVAIRSIFICFTHLKTPSDALLTHFPGILSSLSFHNDLFFSAHTAIPFLGFLIYKDENKRLAYFFLVCSIILAITVLLMHVHYSIDVFSAFFITYGSYKIGEWLFRKINHY